MHTVGVLGGNAHFLGGVLNLGNTADRLRTMEKKPDLLVLWGGEDISPHYYGQQPVRAYAPAKPSQRDKIESDFIDVAVEQGIPILGICRGAQLLCAKFGGSLWQHVTNHTRPHDITYKGKKVITNSCHHQMMRPSAEGEVLAYADTQSPYKWEDSDKPMEDYNPEPEIVLWKRQKALGIQGHPEWVGHDTDFYKLTQQLISEYLRG